MISFDILLSITQGEICVRYSSGYGLSTVPCSRILFLVLLNHLRAPNLDALIEGMCSVISLINFSDVFFRLQDKSLDSYSSELAGIKKAAETAHKCLGSGQAGPWGDRNDAVEELERKVLELNEHQRKVKEQMAHKHKGKIHMNPSVS